MHWTSEDMFGADDADWAIYRKIVSFVASLLYVFPHLSRRTQLPSHRTKKKTC